MKHNILKSIRFRMIVLQSILLLVIMGIVFVAFIFFANDYYYHRKMHSMEGGYERLKKTDVRQLTQKDRLIMELEDKKFRILIADENYELVYVSGPTKSQEKQQEQIKTRIINHMERYQFSMQTFDKKYSIFGCGRFAQNGHTYYVYIWERKLNNRIQFSYYRLFFGIICLMAMAVGVVVAWIISGMISKPIKRIKRAAGNAVENHYELDIDENLEFHELSDLAGSINIMVSQIRSQMQALQEELKQKERVAERRRNFVNNVSHELKTPLAIISSQAEMVQLVKDQDKREAYCRSIMEETETMAELINGMMVTYSSQNDEESFDVEYGDVRECVENVCAKHQTIFENENLTLHQSYDMDCYAMINKGYLEQAVGNYITNSIKHSEENGNVYVRVLSLEDSVRIEVENEGASIPEAYKDKIWDMFYKGDEEETLQGQSGSGLGLYIVKSIAKMHNGTYGFSNLKKGIVFWIEVPKKQKNTGEETT